MGGAAWTWQHGCARRVWLLHDRSRAALNAGRSKLIRALRATSRSSHFHFPFRFTLFSESVYAKNQIEVLSKADLNHLPQSKRSLAGTGRGTGVARSGQAAAIQKRIACADWRAGLQAVLESAQ